MLRPEEHRLIPGPVHDEKVNLSCNACNWFKRVGVEELRQDAVAIRDEHDNSRLASAPMPRLKHDFVIKVQSRHMYLWCTVCSSSKRLSDTLRLVDLEKLKKQHWTHKLW